MPQVRPRRSVLYMPASNARALEKAKTLPADGLVLDLEDAVAPESKVAAREALVAAIKGGGYGKREVVARINALDTPWGHDDLKALAAAGPDGILVPKVSSAAEVERVDALLASAPAKTRLWVMMETPLAILDAKAIAATARKPGSRLSVFVMGTNDLVKETRAELDTNRTQALYWLSVAVTAARAYGLDVLDGVYNNFRDAEGFKSECLQGRRLGMDGKTLIHPDQIVTANEVFQPSETEIAAARKIIAAFEQPENQGKGVITLDGRMVELLHAEMAKRTVALADAIAAMKG
jgi:citrate lyase subunit beta/citryl-CoA lyase